LFSTWKFARDRRTDRQTDTTPNAAYDGCIVAVIVKQRVIRLDRYKRVTTVYVVKG